MRLFDVGIEPEKWRRLHMGGGVKTWKIRAIYQNRRRTAPADHGPADSEARMGPCILH